MLSYLYSNVLFRFSNNVRHPGEVTLPDYMSQPEVECIGQAGHHDDDREFPWWSPGTQVITYNNRLVVLIA